MALFTPAYFMTEGTRLLHSVQGRGQCFPDGVSGLKPRPKSAGANPDLFRPLCKRLGLSAKCDSAVVGSIKHLSSLSGPTNVPRLIVSIIIDTVKAHALRARSKFGNKSAKKHKPWMNHHPLPSVMLGVMTLDLGASGLHVFPGYILSGSMVSMSFHATRLIEYHD